MAASGPDLRTMLQLSDVRVFLEVAAADSFSGAARRLRMPKSSVTRQIERLEGAVGAVLFRRTTRSVTLTDDGRAFLPYARQLYDDGIEAENALRSDAKQASGLLSVSATAAFARPFLVPHLAVFQARHPGVQIKLWLTPTRTEVGSGPDQVDIAIRLRSSAGPNLANRKLGEIDYLVVASPGYVAAHGVPDEPADLKRHRVVELGPVNKAHQIELHRGRSIATVRYTPHLQIDDPEAVCAAVEAGAGIAVLPSFLAAPGVSRRSLVRLLPAWAPPPVPISLLYRTDIVPPARVRTYVDFLFETIGLDQPWRI